MINKDFPDGVLWFTTGTIKLDVHFPEDKVCCKYCDFCRSETELGRYRCRLTGEMLYTLQDVGFKCPVVLDKVTYNE